MTRPPFHLRLISPEEVIFDGPAKSLQFPGLDGLVGVLPGHAPLVAAIAPGPLASPPPTAARSSTSSRTASLA
ncbi:MAG: F0F1 ATP synthase subunit epsilon [Planctomycetes bacterium]|nr:F0F1 ATP synthase subunit epsilon [Planctomycetota bacterium]